MAKRRPPQTMRGWPFGASRTTQVCLEQVHRANTRWRPSASQRLHPSRSHAWSLTVIDGCMRLCEPAIPVGMAS
jgi:hypothetical protein